jgi:uncharacterized protein
MAIVKKIRIEVAYANISQQKIIHVELDFNSTIEQAIHASGILISFPEIDLTQQAVGIFSKKKKLTDYVREGDRIEIYRPLTIDPKEARKKRAR